MDDDAQPPNQGDGPLTPGGTQRPGEPGGPLAADQRPEKSMIPEQPDPRSGEPLPEGGPRCACRPSATSTAEPMPRAGPLDLWVGDGGKGHAA